MNFDWNHAIVRVTQPTRERIAEAITSRVDRGWLFVDECGTESEAVDLIFHTAGAQHPSPAH